MAPTAKDGVTYIPPAVEQDEADSHAEDREIKDRAARRSPMRLFAEDCYLLMKNLRSFPNIFLPLRETKPLPGVPKVSLIYGHTVVGLLSVIQIPLLLAALPTALILPGWLTGGLTAVGTTLMWLLARSSWGPLTVESQVDGVKDKFKNEYWLFVNGIATSHAQLQSTVNNLSATFGRPVTGVHNQSWGIPGDLIECLIQRSFFYDTQDVRVATAAIQKAIEDDAITKVVILAHSQGGLIVSLVLDHLYVSMPSESFKKLEIYTFGSAASYFHNPLSKAVHSESISPVARKTLAKSASDTLALERTDLASAQLRIPNRLVPIIEHYVNGRDLVPKWGVLYHILLKKGSDYSGRVFVHERQSGHLFDQHYLSIMFPLDAVDEVKTEDATEGSAKKIVLKDDKMLFLNHKISLQEKVKGGQRWWGIWRASTWGRRTMADKSAPPALTTDSSGVTEKSLPLSETSNGDAGVGGTASVKDLSKLWRYLDGGVA